MQVAEEQVATLTKELADAVRDRDNHAYNRHLAETPVATLTNAHANAVQDRDNNAQHRDLAKTQVATLTNERDGLLKENEARRAKPLREAARHLAARGLGQHSGVQPVNWDGLLLSGDAYTSGMGFAMECVVLPTNAHAGLLLERTTCRFATVQDLPTITLTVEPPAEGEQPVTLPPGLFAFYIT